MKMKFIVDCMLGKLARWLKILGFNVSYFQKIEDNELLASAEKEERILLTRDNGLIEKAKVVEHLFIKSEDWKKQVTQVLKHFDLWSLVNPYSRCIECNVELKNITKEKAKNLVVPFIYEQKKSFALCPHCGQVFWKGTHFDDMEFKIKDILTEEE